MSTKPIQPKVGEVYLAELRGRTPWTAIKTLGECRGPVKLTWVSTDSRVVEGVALRKVKGKWVPKCEVTLPRCYLVELFRD